MKKMQSTTTSDTTSAAFDSTSGTTISSPAISRIKAASDGTSAPVIKNPSGINFDGLGGVDARDIKNSEAAFIMTMHQLRSAQDKNEKLEEEIKDLTERLYNAINQSTESKRSTYIIFAGQLILSIGVNLWTDGAKGGIPVILVGILLNILAFALPYIKVEKQTTKPPEGGLSL